MLRARRLLSAADMHDLPNGRIVRTASIVTVRQQRDTANGTVSVSLEDETCAVQVICWKQIKEHKRHVLMHARLIAVYGIWLREGECAT